LTTVYSDYFAHGYMPFIQGLYLNFDCLMLHYA
jgi:hypothetical protein